jgi:hypothetical protein
VGAAGDSPTDSSRCRTTPDFLYKTTDYWYPQHERTLLWNDPALGIEWPLAGDPILAPKDAAGTPLARADAYLVAPLPPGRFAQAACGRPAILLTGAEVRSARN